MNWAIASYSPSARLLLDFRTSIRGLWLSIWGAAHLGHCEVRRLENHLLTRKPNQC